MRRFLRIALLSPFLLLTMNTQAMVPVGQTTDAELLEMFRYQEARAVFALDIPTEVTSQGELTSAGRETACCIYDAPEYAVFLTAAHLFMELNIDPGVVTNIPSKRNADFELGIPEIVYAPSGNREKGETRYKVSKVILHPLFLHRIDDLEKNRKVYYKGRRQNIDAVKKLYPFDIAFLIFDKRYSYSTFMEIKNPSFKAATLYNPKLLHKDILSYQCKNGFSARTYGYGTTFSGNDLTLDGRRRGALLTDIRRVVDQWKQPMPYGALGACLYTTLLLPDTKSYTDEDELFPATFRFNSDGTPCHTVYRSIPRCHLMDGDSGAPVIVDSYDSKTSVIVGVYSCGSKSVSDDGTLMKPTTGDNTIFSPLVDCKTGTRAPFVDEMLQDLLINFPRASQALVLNYDHTKKLSCLNSILGNTQHNQFRRSFCESVRWLYKYMASYVFFPEVLLDLLMHPGANAKAIDTVVSSMPDCHKKVFFPGIAQHIMLREKSAQTIFEWCQHQPLTDDIVLVLTGMATREWMSSRMHLDIWQYLKNNLPANLIDSLSDEGEAPMVIDQKPS